MTDISPVFQHISRDMDEIGCFVRKSVSQKRYGPHIHAQLDVWAKVAVRVDTRVIDHVRHSAGLIRGLIR